MQLVLCLIFEVGEDLSKDLIALFFFFSLVDQNCVITINCILERNVFNEATTIIKIPQAQ